MIAPTLTGTAGDGFCDLVCTAVSGAVKYRFFVDGVAIGKRQAERTLRVSGLANGRTYGFQVRGIDTSGAQGPLSNPPLQLTPKAPVAAAIVGYGAGVTGGGPTVTHTIDTGSA